MMDKTDVLIVGSGPTGLTLACELARHGIIPAIIDKASAPSDKSKAFGIHARTMEIFENMGIVEKVLTKGNICDGLNIYNRGKQIAEMRIDNLKSKYPFFLILAQSDTEKILIEHLKTYGIEVQRQTELISFEQNDNEIFTKVKNSNETNEIKCKYLIGCDGAHSTVRNTLNLEFKGAPYPNHWLLADLNIQWDYPLYHLSAFLHPSGVTAYFPLYENRGRLMFELPNSPIDEEVEEPKIEEVIELAKEREIKFSSITDPTWLAYFTLHHRMVDQYNKGNVFIAGDAAHIHSPVGGQGMNTGIQDAYNLAWKIGLVLRGRSPNNILKSYNIERHRVGEDVVKLTDRATKMITLHNPVFNALRNKMIGFLSNLDSVAEKMLRTLSQIEVNYKGSPIVGEDWKIVHQSSFGHSPKGLEPGERIADYILYDHQTRSTTNLYDLLMGREHELLLFTGFDPGEEDYIRLREVAVEIPKQFGDLMEIHIIKGERALPPELREFPSIHVDKNFQLHKDLGAALCSLYLIRPDGYIAYRNQPLSIECLTNYLSGIFI